MQVTNCRVKPFKDQRTNTIAYVDLTLDESIVIKGARLVSGKNGLFLAMPSRMIRTKDGKPQKDANGKNKFVDIVFPCTSEARSLLESAAKEEFEKVKEESGDSSLV